MTCSMRRSVDVRAVDGSGPLIALVSDQRDWHARQMEAAFIAGGARFERIDLAKCGFDTTNARGLALQHLGSRLPDAVHVRTLANGSFEAITKRLGVLHALSGLGVPVWNDARTIERCVDKSMTSFELARAGLPTPSTWTIESFDEARDLVLRESRRGPLVLKPLFGSQGMGLRLVRSPDDLPTPDEVAGVYYLQRFEAVEGEGFHDYRLFVVKGRVAAAMLRRSPTWITNVKQGGEPWSVGRDAQMERLATAAARAVGATIAGVDILVAAEGGPTVLEVNSMPAWSGLQIVADVNIAEVIAAELMAAVVTRAALEPAL
jgi:tetrahydromethanopterin:alpha-L-glutamate ligase